MAFLISRRPRKAHTLGPNFTTNTSPKKRKPDYPDYIAEITAPLAKEEDFDYMIMPALGSSQVCKLTSVKGSVFTSAMQHK